ncbi:MAG: ATP-binding protein [Thiomargarita sp.]|nr:ATP-binding protein [Thiomargarita sp.]
MEIQYLKFDDHKEHWHLEETNLDPFNLLVGISGVGKTLITEAIKLICQVATESDYQLEGIEWKIGFVHKGQKYEWTLKSALMKADDLIRLLKEDHSTQTQILYEKMTTTQEIIAERSNDFFSFKKENVTPSLNKHESIVTLFSEDETISAIRHAFQSVIFSERNTFQQHFSSPLNFNTITFKEFEETLTQVPLLVKAFFLQKFHQNEFSEIKQYLINIFPSIGDLKVELIENHNHKLFFRFKEKESDNWIPQHRMSAGMFRTLTHLIEISLAPTGSVIVIDEFENSLGINCMPDLVAFILSHAPNLQFIITSHHPYVINNIPWQNWKLVKRHKNRVNVNDAKDIPEFRDEESFHEKFIQLINHPDYRKSVL